MNVSVITAFRETGDGWRTRLWDYIRTRLEREHPDFEIVVGTDDGVDPFHKTLALNRAAHEASGDVLYMLDTDTWTPPAQVDAAVAGIERDPARWWRPYAQKVKLLEPDTRAVLEDPEWVWVHDRRKRYERTTNYWAAPPLLVPRDLFFDVGGMDERARGWGQEDEAFAISLRALHGEPLSISGQCVHLWHPRIGQSGRDLWPGEETYGVNIALARAYHRASRSEAQMRKLIEERIHA